MCGGFISRNLGTPRLPPVVPEGGAVPLSLTAREARRGSDGGPPLGTLLGACGTRVLLTLSGRAIELLSRLRVLLHMEGCQRAIGELAARSNPFLKSRA
jgi:hypothetical protein